MTRTVTVRCPFCNQNHDVDIEINEQEERYECGAELASGESCSREVESPNDACWQHGGE